MQVIFLHDPATTEVALNLMTKVNNTYPKAQCLAMPLDVKMSADLCSWLQVHQQPQIVVRNGDQTTAVLPMTDNLELEMAFKGSAQ